MTRNLGIDVLRILSVVAVVVGHAWPGLPGEEYLQIWRMPLFFFLSGFFLSSQRTLRAEATNRWRTLGVPYVTWLVLLAALVTVHHFTARPFEDTAQTLLGALKGGGWTDMPFLAFWFISVLFFAVLLARLLLLLPWWLQLAAAVGGLALAELPESTASYTVLGIGLVPACAAYILAGFWVRRGLSTVAGAHLTDSRWVALLLGAVLIAAGFAGVAAGAESMNMKWSGFGTFLLSPALALLICLGLVLIFSTWVEAGVYAVGRGAVVVVSELVRTGTLVVFFHAYLLFLVWNMVPNQPLRVLIALSVCWPLGVLVNRTPLSPYLTGLPRPSKPSAAAAPS